MGLCCRPSDGFLGRNLYATTPATTVTIKPVTLRCRGCSIWLMFPRSPLAQARIEDVADAIAEEIQG